MNAYKTQDPKYLKDTWEIGLGDLLLFSKVKWAGGSPRLYDGKKNALPGCSKS